MISKIILGSLFFSCLSAGRQPTEFVIKNVYQWALACYEKRDSLKILKSNVQDVSDFRARLAEVDDAGQITITLDDCKDDRQGFSEQIASKLMRVISEKDYQDVLVEINDCKMKITILPSLDNATEEVSPRKLFDFWREGLFGLCMLMMIASVIYDYINHEGPIQWHNSWS